MRDREFLKSQEFREACEEYFETIVNEYPDCQNRHVFTNEFNEKMNKLLYEEPKRRINIFNTIGKRVAVIIVVIFLALTTTVFSVKAIRVPIIDFIVRMYQEFTSLFVSSEIEYDDDFVFQQKSPKYVLEGFEVLQEKETDVYYQITYASNDGASYYYKQDTLYQNQKIDTNNYSDVVEFDGVKMYYYNNNRENKLIWHDGTYSYMIFGIISKEDMVQIAKSVE